MAYEEVKPLALAVISILSAAAGVVIFSVCLSTTSILSIAGKKLVVLPSAFWRFPWPSPSHAGPHETRKGWDESLPADRRSELFRDQAFRDTDAAIVRLFQILPDLDTIEVRVLEPRPPNRTILAGTVARRDADAARPLASPGMRLRLMGVRCRLEGGRLAPLD